MRWSSRNGYGGRVAGVAGLLIRSYATQQQSPDCQ
jgi:hypothetical protein